MLLEIFIILHQYGLVMLPSLNRDTHENFTRIISFKLSLLAHSTFHDEQRTENRSPIIVTCTGRGVPLHYLQLQLAQEGRGINGGLR